MGSTERDWREEVTIDPAIQGGRPVIKGTRMPVEIVVGSLGGGMSLAEVCEEYHVTRQHVRAAVRYTRRTHAR